MLPAAYDPGVADTVTYERRGPVAIIALRRPEKRNALDLASFQALGEAAEHAAADAEARAVVVRGEGVSFCAGIDLLALAGLAGSALDRFAEFVAIAQRPYRALAELPKPVVAAVRGHALGAGFQLALACDLRVVGTDATFGLLEARFGIVPDLGGMWHLVRETGPSRTKELAWSARTIDAAEAERIGLIAAVVPHEELPARVEQVIESIRQTGPAARAAVKHDINRHLPAFDIPMFSASLRSAEVAEGFLAFVEKRPPKWRGE